MITMRIVEQKMLKYFETIQHNTVYISILLCTRNPYSYSHFEIFICMFSVRGEIELNKYHKI